jgi:hypothetical protein
MGYGMQFGDCDKTMGRTEGSILGAWNLAFLDLGHGHEHFQARTA